MLEYKLTDDGVLIETERNVVDNVLKEVSTNNEVNQMKAEVPTELGFWQKFKKFWTKEVDLFAPVDFTLRLTPYQSKVLNEVKDFWTQDVRNDFKWN